MSSDWLALVCQLPCQLPSDRSPSTLFRSVFDVMTAKAIHLSDPTVPLPPPHPGLQVFKHGDSGIQANQLVST